MVYNSSENPALAVSNGHVYVVWNGYRGMPDSSALYFSYSPYEPNVIGDSRGNDLPDGIEFSAYPNPFNSSTTLSIGNGEPSDIFIYDITGRQIASLFAKEGKAEWNAGAYSSGVYFAKASGGNKSSVIKLIYLK